jgi:predicted RNase H-like HicB family nuclease
MKSKLSLIIRWSEEDKLFIAWVPELGTAVKTHGKTYVEAAKQGQQMIEGWESSMSKQTLSTARPWTYHSPLEDERIGQILLPGNPCYHSDAKPKRVKQSA